MLALLFGMMLYSSSGDGIANIPRNLLQMIVTPVQTATAWLSDEVGGFFDQFLNAKRNADENEQLHAEISELRRQLVDYEKLKGENKQIKDIAGIKEVHPDFEMAAAFVISRDPNDSYGSFLIDKGTLHGVAVKDPVLTADGLVGIVTQAGLTSSRVRTILSPQINVSAFENTSRELGMIRGSVKLSQQGLTKFSILASETSVQEGDMVVTAGASGLFPKGVPVGRVQEIQTESNGVTKYAVLRPFEDVTKTETVIVITHFLGQGSELLGFSE